ncbi:MAG: hypothetical protein AB7G93_12910 [Bdellovibrionales bacterium]
MSHATKKINWQEIEALGCTGRRLPQLGEHSAVEIYRARNLEFNLRKAEALSASGEVDPLQVLRTAIARGKIQDSQNQLQSAIQAQPSLLGDPEWRLEKARLAAFTSQWQDCIQNVNEVLRLAPSSITRMTALQTRALAWYELGQWNQAERDVDLVRSFAELYPNAQAAYFNELLRVRILALRGDFAAAEKRLAEIWMTDGRQGSLNILRFLALLRTEAVLARLCGRSARSTLIASHTVANVMGDDLYAALARLELNINGDPSVSLASRVQADAMKFPKVQSLRDEVISGPLTSTTGRLLKESREHSTASLDFLSAQPVKIVLPHRKIVVNLEPFSSQWMEKPTRAYQALCELGGSEKRKKEDLFGNIFRQRYVEHLHGPLLRQLFSRLRRQFQVQVNVSEGLVACPDALTVTQSSTT